MPSITDSEYYLVDVEETGKYFIDSKQHLCKEAIHILISKARRVRMIMFKRIDHDGTDLGAIDRHENNMILIPSYIVDKIFISLG